MPAKKYKRTWHELGVKGAEYPPAVRALKGKSGVYAIRLKAVRGFLGGVFGIEREPVVVYVGESHTDNLYETLTRHFQVWTRQKDWWVTSGYRPAQGDPGHTYERHSVEVAFRVGSRKSALTWQHAWFDELKPRDNMIEPVPF